MADGITTGDLALMDRGDFGNNSFLWIFALLILAGGGFNGFGNNRNGFGDYATAASQQEILFGQQFQNLDNKMDRLGNGIADATFSLNNSVINEGRNLGAAVNAGFSNIQNCCCDLKYDMATQFANSNANTTAQIQKVLDAISTNRMADMQSQINNLQLQLAMSGTVKYPMSSTYSIGMNPYCNTGSCGCN